MMTRSGWYDSASAIRIRHFIRGRAFAVAAMTALFFALFLTDICVLAQVDSNTEQNVILMIVFGIFLFEFLGLVFTDASYLLGFFLLDGSLGNTLNDF
jgi:hypothetical protein